jgi:hypothetical protein
MDVLSTTTTKGQAGWNAAKTAVQNQDLTRFTVWAGDKSTLPLANLSFRLSNPFTKPQTRRERLEQIVEQTGETLGQLGEAIFEIGEVVGAMMAAYGPLAARQLGWAEAPRAKRTAPRVVAGAVIGAGAVYFLEPKCGPERREQVLRLINGGPPEQGGVPPQPAAAPEQPAGAPTQTT